MKRIILTAVVVLSSLMSYAQHTIKGEIEGVKVSFKFKDKYNYVIFSAKDESTSWLRVAVFETSEEDDQCKVFRYITNDGIVTVMFCNDMSMSALLPNGNIVTGWVYSANENSL